MKRALPFYSRAVWPPFILVAIFVFAYGALAAGVWFLEPFGPGMKGQLSHLPEIDNMRLAILGGAAALFATCRVWRFHPACNLRYSAWLSFSPWTSAKPLPLGPVNPVWQDFVVIGILCGLAHWHAGLDWYLPLVVFWVTYMIEMTLLLMLTRTWTIVVLVGFITPTLFLPASKGDATLGNLVALTMVIWFGFRTSLDAFPWPHILTVRPEIIRSPDTRAGSTLNIEVGAGRAVLPISQGMDLGWPMASLSPKIQLKPLRNITTVCVSALVGWWIYCVNRSLDDIVPTEAILFFAILFALIRTLIYTIFQPLFPSFGVRGRLATGRLVVPGFDQVFVTPMVVVLVAVAGGIVIRHSGRWQAAADATVIALICFTGLIGGPTLRKWNLTGQHRHFRRPASARAVPPAARHRT